MKHLCELPVPLIRKIFQAPYWDVSEKFDGSFLRAGIDESGRFYTSRGAKGKGTFYNVSDWPDLAWTNYFRNAHVALNEVIELFKDKFNISEPFYCDVEIIAGNMPNSIHYSDARANSLVIIGCSKNIAGETFSNLLFDMTIHTSTDFWYSDNGVTRVKRKNMVEWKVYETYSSLSFDLSFFIRKQIYTLESWFDDTCEFRGSQVTNAQILEAKLNKRPEFINELDWSEHRSTIVAELKAIRTEKTIVFEQRCNEFAREMILSGMGGFFNYDGMETEGFVVNVVIDKVPIQFKIVDKSHFSSLNNFTHIVRYWLQGGRRPERPSFISRTRDWPVEKRIERLDVLRKRFLLNYSRLSHKTVWSSVSYSQRELFERTLVLFAEIRERIQNGRDGVQRQSSTDQ